MIIMALSDTAAMDGEGHKAAVSTAGALRQWYAQIHRELNAAGHSGHSTFHHIGL